MKPIMMKKWKWASIEPSGEGHQHRRAVGEPGRDQHRCDPPVLDQPAEDQAGRRGR
jgi:hypothetical protein